MAEGGDSWWGSWIQSAREKGTNVLEFMKKDLDEFTQTFQQETKTAVSHAAGALREKLQIDESASAANQVKKSFSTLLDSVSHAFTPVREENEDELCIIHNSEPVILDRVQSQIYGLQVDLKTYLEEPLPSDEYDEWLNSFDLEQKQAELSEIMINNSEVQSLYTKLVPSSLSHLVFWHRYFFKLHHLSEAEVRKKALLERADMKQNEDLRWDDEDILTHSEISEQMACQLLSDYEEECKERKKLEDENKNSLRQLDTKRNANHPHEEFLVDHDGVHTNFFIANELDFDAVTIKQLTEEMSEGSSISEKASPEEKSELMSTKEDLTNLPIAPPKNPVHITVNELKELDCNKTESTTEVLMSNAPNDCNAEILDNFITKERADLVVIDTKNSNRISPASSNKESSNDEEWEKDFELTEEDLINVQNATKKLSGETDHAEVDDDWENWD